MNENNKETKREYAKVYRFGDRVAIHVIIGSHRYYSFASESFEVMP